jgi:hypothetical protein
LSIEIGSNRLFILGFGKRIELLEEEVKEDGCFRNSGSCYSQNESKSSIFVGPSWRESGSSSIKYLHEEAAAKIFFSRFLLRISSLVASLETFD